MVDPKVAVTVTAIDKATKVFDNIKSSASSMGSSITDTAASFILITESISRAINMVKQFTEGAIEYDAAVTRSAIAMGLATDEANMLRESIDLLADTAAGGIFSHLETAKAFAAIADEGRGVQGTLDTVRNAMNLAAVAGGDLALITRGIEDVMSAFKLEASDATRIVDVLANTMFATGTAVDVQIPSLIQLGRIMTGIGVSFEETAALIGVLKDAGVGQIQGLLTGFQQMASGTGNAAIMMENFGVSAFDVNGNLRTMSEVFNDLLDAGATTSDMFVAFGQRSAAAMGVIIDAMDAVQTTAESNLSAVGTAADGAAQFLESDAAETQKFESAMEDLKIELAEGVLPALVQMVGILTPLIGIIADNTDVILGLVTAYIAFKIALWAYTIAQWAANVAAFAFPGVWLAAGILAVILALVLLWQNWDRVTEAIKENRQWLLLLIGVPIIGQIILISLALVTLYENWDRVTASVQAFVAVVLGMVTTIFNLAETMREMGQDAGTAWMDGLKEGILDNMGPIGDAVDEVGKWFGGSLPEKGKLANVEQAGEEIAVAWFDGMQNPNIIAGVEDMTNRTGDAFSGNTASTLPPSGANEGGGQVVNNYFLVDAEEFWKIQQTRNAEDIAHIRRTQPSTS